MRSAKEWVEFLNQSDLPALRRSTEELGKLARRMENLQASEVARIILHDPFLTLRVMRMANRPRKSHFDSEITTVEHAVAVIGLPPLFNALSRLPVVEGVMAGKEKLLELLLRSVSQSFHVSYQARDWAALRKDTGAEEVEVAGLLKNSAELLLLYFAASEMRQTRSLMRKQGLSAEEAERQALGASLAEIQSELFAAWRMPKLILDVMGANAASATQPRCQIVPLASGLMRRAAKGWHEAALEGDYQALGELLHISPEDAAAIVHVNAAISGRAWHWYGVLPPGAWLPMLPGEWPEEPEEDDETAPARAKGKVDDEPHIRKRRATAHPDEFNRVMAEIAAHLDQTLNLHDMMTLVMRGMQEGIGMERIVFAIMAADRASVRAKYVIGAAEDSPLRQFQFPLKNANLFAKLMERVQGIWVRRANRAQIAGLLTPEIEAMTGGEEFFAMSLFVHGKPVGLFYADRKDNEFPLTEKNYLDFKSLCLRAAEGLAHLAAK